MRCRPVMRAWAASSCTRNVEGMQNLPVDTELRRASAAQLAGSRGPGDSDGALPGPPARRHGVAAAGIHIALSAAQPGLRDCSEDGCDFHNHVRYEQ